MKRLILAAGVLFASTVLLSCGPRDFEYPEGETEHFDTVYEIQSDDPSVEHPELGSMVRIRSAIVTAYDSYAEPTQDREQRGAEYVCIQTVGYTGSAVVQDYAGGEYSGISLFNPTVVPSNTDIGAGDLVDVIGEYLEFCLAEPDFVATSYCDAPDTDRLSQLGGATLTRVGEAVPPEPLQISASDLMTPARAEPYEGVLVRVTDRLTVEPCTPTDSRNRPNCCVGDYDRYGNLATNAFNITNEYYSIPEGTRCISSITGIVSWFFDYSLSPRGPEDVVIPDECRADGG